MNKELYDENLPPRRSARITAFRWLTNAPFSHRSRTALGFLAAGVGLDELAPDFATPLIHEILALLLCLFAGGMAIYGYLRLAE